MENFKRIILPFILIAVLIAGCSSLQIKDLEPKDTPAAEKAPKSAPPEKKEEVKPSAVQEHKVIEETLAASPQPMQMKKDLPAKYLIATQKTVIRFANSIKSKVIATIRKGEKLQMIDELNDWFKVTTAKGKRGWIAKDAVKRAQ